MVFSWKQGSQIREDATEAAKVFDELAKGKGLTPKNVVDVSRKENAPLHGYFEWDDAKAGELYRERQAGHLIRCLIVQNEEEPKTEPTRVFFSLHDNRGYERIDVICESIDKTAKLVEIARGELRSFTKKYESINELGVIVDRIKDFLEE